MIISACPYYVSHYSADFIVSAIDKKWDLNTLHKNSIDFNTAQNLSQISEYVYPPDPDDNEDYFDRLSKRYHYVSSGFSNKAHGPKGGAERGAERDINIGPIDISSLINSIISKIKHVLYKHGHLKISICIEYLNHTFVLYTRSKQYDDHHVYIIDSYAAWRKAEMREFDYPVWAEGWENVLRTLFSKEFTLEWWNTVFKGNELVEPEDKGINSFEISYHTEREGYLKVNGEIVNF